MLHYVFSSQNNAQVSNKKEEYAVKNIMIGNIITILTAV